MPKVWYIIVENSKIYSCDSAILSGRKFTFFPNGLYHIHYSHTKLKVFGRRQKLILKSAAVVSVAILFHNHNRSGVWSSKATNPADLLIIFECNNLDPYAYMAQQRLFGSLAITYGNNGSKVTTLHRGPD